VQAAHSVLPNSNKPGERRSFRRIAMLFGPTFTCSPIAPGFCRRKWPRNSRPRPIGTFRSHSGHHSAAAACVRDRLFRHEYEGAPVRRLRLWDRLRTILCLMAAASPICSFVVIGRSLEALKPGPAPAAPRSFASRRRFAPGQGQADPSPRRFEVKMLKPLRRTRVPRLRRRLPHLSHFGALRVAPTMLVDDVRQKGPVHAQGCHIHRFRSHFRRVGPSSVRAALLIGGCRPRSRDCGCGRPLYGRHSSGGAQMNRRARQLGIFLWRRADKLI
jgi:hypothetical protein